MADYFGHEDTRTIAVRRWMIEATRDDDGSANYAAAILLAQVTFWCEPSARTGRPRAAHEHGDHTWLVRSDAEWGDELGMSDRLARRARKRLETLGLVEAKTLVDKGVRCTHLRRLPLAEAAEEPSTIRPKEAVATGLDGQTSRPKAADGVTVQADSHAGASSTSSSDVVETIPAERPERDPQLLRAEVIVRTHWDWCHEHDEPTPTLLAKGNPFLALRNIVRGLLDAGYLDAEVQAALKRTAAYTTNALTVALRQRRTAGGGAGMSSAQEALVAHRAQRNAG